MRNAHGFHYEGPAELLDTVARALKWVTNPQSGRKLLEEGGVQRVRLEQGLADVELPLAPGPVTQVIVEDVETELYDHLQGQWRIKVRLVQPPSLTLAWAQPAPERLTSPTGPGRRRR